MATIRKTARCTYSASSRARHILRKLETANVIPRVVSAEFNAGADELVVVMERYDLDVVEYRRAHPFELAVFEETHLRPLIRRCASLGVVHLDLRPENVVLKVGDRGEILDARLIDLEPRFFNGDLYEFVFQDERRRGEYEGRAVVRRRHLMMGVWCSLLTMRDGWNSPGDGSWIDDPMIDIYEHELTDKELHLVTMLVVQQAAQLGLDMPPRYTADVMSRCNRTARMKLSDWAHRSRDLDRAREMSVAVPVDQRRSGSEHVIVRVNGRWRLVAEDPRR